MKKKIIITGFGPFGPYAVNPTEELALMYDGQTIKGRELIKGIVLPATYISAFRILEGVIKREKPDVIISLGLSSSVPGLRIENRFVNIMGGKYPDAGDYEPKGVPVVPTKKAPNYVAPMSDSFQMAGLLNAEGFPVEVSIDANSFICNSLGYLTSTLLQKEYPAIKNMFIHIPWPDSYANRVTLGEGKKFMDGQVILNALDFIIQSI